METGTMFMILGIAITLVMAIFLSIDVSTKFKHKLSKYKDYLFMLGILFFVLALMFG